nr:zinc finger protein RFP-like [Monopterus albus]XP_020460810.1 zinc finger protein RFP-like [Monopterus albus]
MALSTTLLSEEQLLCSICLDVFTRPVSTPCGHNFCMTCITTYWSDTPVCQCPLCKETFERKPELKVNTFISELVSQFMSLQITDAHIRSLEQQQANSGSTVLCDICTGTQENAVKSCLECLTSYCNVHLEPHHRAAGLKRHTLVNPLTRLEDRICKEHNRLLILFCKNDKVLLCDICSGSRHMNHNVVTVEQAYKEMKDLLKDTEAKVQHMSQQRQQKVRAMEESLKQRRRETDDVLANSEQDLTALVSEIQKSQMELVKVMEEKQKDAEEEVNSLISDMAREIAELQRTAMKLRELKQTKDQLCFLQKFPNSCSLPQMMDLSTFSLNRHLKIQHVRKFMSSSVSQLQMLVNKMNTEIKRFTDGTGVSEALTLRYMQQYEVNIFLDPDTAHPLLVVSENGKQVRYTMGSGVWEVSSLNPDMFMEHLAVLGQIGFSSRKFYFEVFVGPKTEWCLGVATASLPRRGGLARTPQCGLWVIWFLEDKFETYCSPGVPVHWGKVERVGVFVDYDGGQISFYDVQTTTLIYSFTECSFTEELYPYFNPCDNEYGSNLGPMIIVPVSDVT